jgi:hypothetical protein
MSPVSRQVARAALAVALAASLGHAAAQDNTFKIGLIVPLTGPFASTGKQLEAAARLYMAQNGDTVAGRKVVLIVKDDAATPETTKRIAQEMVVTDKVQVLAGFGLTPLAMATVSSWLSTSAKRGATSTRSAKPITFIARAAAPTLPAWLGRTSTKRVGSATVAAVLVAWVGPGRAFTAVKWASSVHGIVGAPRSLSRPRPSSLFCPQAAPCRKRSTPC